MLIVLAYRLLRNLFICLINWSIRSCERVLGQRVCASLASSSLLSSRCNIY